MAKRSKVYDLPPELRDELNEKLVSTGFQGYAGLADWLAEHGFKVSRSSVQRYGQDLQEEFDEAMGDVRKTTELARAMASEGEDESGHLIDATARIVQDQLLRITIAMRKAEHEPEDAAKHLASVTRALADIGRVSLGQKKWAREILQEKRAELEGKVDKAAKGKTLTVEDFKAAVAEVYGG
tara:strand:- start:1588 stop:2133 length:546 start_codon:yes stop_codon:yes gene_type:complete